jgi:hypothetical protein
VRSELLELWQRRLLSYVMWLRVVWCVSTKFSDESAASICRIEDENIFITKHKKITGFWDVTPRSQLTFRRITLLSFSVQRKDSLIYYANLKYNIPVFWYRTVCILVDPSYNVLWNLIRTKLLSCDISGERNLYIHGREKLTSVVCK